MIIDKASEKEIDELVELRLAYLQEDLGAISEQDMQCLQAALPQYFRNHKELRFIFSKCFTS